MEETNVALRDRLVDAGLDEVSVAILSEGRIVRVVRRNRDTGTPIVVRDFGLASEPGFRWSTTCVAHLSDCPHETRRLAVANAADPAAWCGLCREISEARREEER